MKTLLQNQILIVLAVMLTSMQMARSVRAEFVFGEPQPLELGSGGLVSVSADGLELYFASDRPGLGYEDLWLSTRKKTDDPWGMPTNLDKVNSEYREAFPCTSPDGLTLYFSDYFYGPDRPGGLGGHDLWMSTRSSPNDSWGAPTNMGAPFNSAHDEVSPTISPDGLTFFFASKRDTGNYDVYACPRATVEDAWGPPVSLGPVVNSGSHDYYGNLSPDGLVLLFESNRGGSYAGWMTSRPSVDAPWTSPIPLPGQVGARGVGCFTGTGLSFYAGMSLVQLGPVLDFSGNGLIDTKDLLRLIECWDQENPTVDIGPAPFGDGIVNKIDLEILMDHWGQEVDDPTLKACYKLDESMGDLAFDSGGTNDALAVGQPNWQPEGGRVNGALQFDGVDDYLSTPFTLNPAKTVFSVFVWVKGGASGRSILSQANGVDWLLTNSQGCLMTDLISAGRRAGGPLISEAIITDNSWHRIGLVWDGNDRILYVDDVEVARDTLGGLKGCDGSLNIGVGNGFEAGSFWSGMIDDVRIHERAVIP